MTPNPNGKPVSSSYGVTNAAPCCFGRQVLSTTSPIRLRLSMCPSWLLFSGNIKDCKGYSRPEKEILDEADLTLRYDWACVDARIHGQKAPTGIDGGIVIERHYAFNWIIGANNGADWDHIQPNT